MSAARVVTQLRPTFPWEDEELRNVITFSDNGRLVCGRTFEADRVYTPADAHAMFAEEVQPLIASVFEGFNATVFAYGASGAGKTHTVVGGKQHCGLASKVADDIFDRYDSQTCTVTVSVEELYCEHFTDLLATPAKGSKQPSVCVNLPNGGKYKKYSLRAKPVCTGHELKQLLHRTLLKRRTASTLLNDKSSRSHVLITLTVEQRVPVLSNKQSSGIATAGRQDSCTESASCSSSCSGSTAHVQDDDELQLDARTDSSITSSVADEGLGICTYLIGKLHLVDLAGSENIKRSGAEGRHQKEAGNINQSLCHLKTVIEEVFRGGKVVTYRNSKLTHRLQDALGGGNSKLLVIACISTARANLAQTKETLRFAEMARAITNKPVVNREPKDELIHRLQQQLEDLQEQLSGSVKGGVAADELLQVQQEFNAVEAAYAELQQQLESKEIAWAEEAAAAQQHQDALQQQIAAADKQLFTAKCQVVAVQQQLSATEDRLSATASESIILQQQLVTATEQVSADKHENSALQEVIAMANMEKQQLQSALHREGSLLQAANAEFLVLGSRCNQLQEQVATQQAEIAAMNSLCNEQQQQTCQAQEHLMQQALQLQALQQQLQHQQAAHTAVEADSKSLQQQLQQAQTARLASESAAKQLSWQLASQQAAMADFSQQVAQIVAVDLQTSVSMCDQLTQQLTAAAGRCAAALEEHSALEQQITQWQDAHSNLQQQLADAHSVLEQHKQLLQSEQDAHRSIKQQLTEAHSNVQKHKNTLHTEQQQTMLYINSLDTITVQMCRVQLLIRDLQQQLIQQEEGAATAGSRFTELLQSAQQVQQYLQAECRHNAKLALQLAEKRAQNATLQQQLAAQQQQHQANQQAATEQAAQMGVQQQSERESWKRALATAKASIAQLQQQVATEKAAHAQALAALNAQHQQQLSEVLQQSTKKLEADKHAARKSLALQVHSLKAEAASISEALDAQLVADLPLTPAGASPGALSGLVDTGTVPVGSGTMDSNAVVAADLTADMLPATADDGGPSFSPLASGCMTEELKADVAHGCYGGAIVAEASLAMKAAHMHSASLLAQQCSGASCQGPAGGSSSTSSIADYRASAVQVPGSAIAGAVIARGASMPNSPGAFKSSCTIPQRSYSSATEVADVIAYSSPTAAITPPTAKFTAWEVDSSSVAGPLATAANELQQHQQQSGHKQGSSRNDAGAPVAPVAPEPESPSIWRRLLTPKSRGNRHKRQQQKQLQQQQRHRQGDQAEESDAAHQLDRPSKGSNGEAALEDSGGDVLAAFCVGEPSISVEVLMADHRVLGHDLHSSCAYRSQYKDKSIQLRRHGRR